MLPPHGPFENVRYSQLFADLDGGYRVGFSGLKNWAEIDISRRNYPGPILWGGAMALAGAVVWIAALFVRP